MNRNIEKTPIKEQLDYIKNRIESYAVVVNSSVSSGLIDEAFLFEDFAKEICEFFFNQEFVNLNIIKPNWKCVDLKSKNGDVFIQASVTKYSKAKIKKTLKELKALRKKKDDDVKDIKRIVFFLLNTDSIKTLEKVDIDGIEFNPKKDVIFLPDIYKKARSSKTFRNKVFAYLYDEATIVNGLSSKLYDVVRNSKGCFLDDIHTTIGTTGFHLDRTIQVEKIRNSNSKIVIITGEAGSGKSAICKEVIKDEKVLLFARAEQVIDAKNINEIWSIHLRTLLKCLKNETVTFCVDSLEFVSDSLGKDKVIDELLLLTREFENIKIYLTCRTRDYINFQNIFLKYEKDLFVENVDNLSIEEKDRVLKEFPFIKKLGAAFTNIITTPLYVDIIVRNSIEKKIKSIADFKRIIYEECICLSKKKFHSHNLLEQTVRTIVVERSNKRALGISKSLIDEKALNFLIDHNVVTCRPKYGVRLKYDLFEDICFCQYFNDDFDNGYDVDAFLKEIEKYGESSFRRYQIWISDLISSKEYEKVSNILIKCTIPFYSKNTIIGILISDNSQEFINYLARNNAIDFEKYIGICNEYAFEPTKNNGAFTLYPIGTGRLALLENISLDSLSNKTIDVRAVACLLKDLIQQKQYIKDASEHISDVTNKVFELLLTEEWLDYDLINEIITVPFYIQQYSKDWFIPLMNDILHKYLHNGFKDGERLLFSLFEYHIEDSMRTQIHYSKEFAEFMVEISYKFFTTNPDKKAMRGHFPFYDADDRFEKRFGLSKAAYSFSDDCSVRDYPLITSFFITLIRSSLPFALTYLFRLTDFIGDYLINEKHATTTDITLVDGTNKSFVYCDDLFVVGESETPRPAFLSDMFYVAKRETQELLKASASDKELCTSIIKSIYSICINNSKTAASLSLLSFVSQYLFLFYPEAIFSLAESYEIIIRDILLFHEENGTDLNKEFIIQHMFSSLGMPYKKRYDLKREIDLGSALYSLYLSRDFDKAIYKSKMAAIYDKYKSNKKVISFYKGHDGSMVSPKQLVETRKKQIEKKDNYLDRNNYINNKIASVMQNRDVEEAKELVDYILSLPGDESHIHSRWLICAIAIIIMDSKTSLDDRNKYCQVWINGIESKRAFLFDDSFIVALLAQIKYEIASEQKEWIKRYMFRVLTSSYNDTSLMNQTPYVISFLSMNEELRTELINALLACSTIHKEVFGFNKNKLFSEEEYTVLKKKEEKRQYEAMDDCLFNNKNYDIYDFDFKECNPVFLEKACQLMLTEQNCRIKDGLLIVGGVFDQMISEDWEKRSLYLENDLAFSLSLPMLNSHDNAKKIIDFLFEYIHTHGYNKYVFETINFTLCKMERLLFGNDSAKELLFSILAYISNRLDRIKECDKNNEIKLGMIFIRKSSYLSRTKTALSLNSFQKNALITFYALNSSTDLNRILYKLSLYSPNALMPEILEIINVFVKDLLKNEQFSVLNESKHNLEEFVCSLYFDYQEAIKSNKLLSMKYQELLESISSIKSSKANVVSIFFRSL